MRKKIRTGVAARLVGCAVCTITQWRREGLIGGEPFSEHQWLYYEDEILAMKEQFRRHGKKGVVER